MTKHSSPLTLIIIAVVFLIVGWFGHQYFGDQVAALFSQTPAAPLQTPSDQNTSSSDNGTTCAQVVTLAQNPKTGEIKQYPAPCDVPEGWVVMHNDVPGIDLEPQ